MTQINLSNRTKRKGEKLDNYKYRSVSVINTKVDRFLDQYHQFKINYVETPQAKIRNMCTVAVSGMVIRQVQTLDALRAVSMSGRPHAAYILLRHMYEVYLDLLLISFHDETIEIPCNTRANKTQRTRWTRKNFALCYFHFRLHVLVQNFNYFYSIDEEQVQRKSKIDKEMFERQRTKREKQVERIRKLYGWKSSTNEWRPLSIGALKDHLWQNGNPLFPAEVGTYDKRDWDHLFYVAFGEGSHHVHSNSHSMMQSYSMDERNFVDYGIYDDQPSSIGLDLTKFSLLAFAHMMGISDIVQLDD